MNTHSPALHVRRPSVHDAITEAANRFEVESGRRLVGLTVTSDAFDDLVEELRAKNYPDVTPQLADVAIARAMGIERRLNLEELVVCEDRASLRKGRAG